MEDKKREIPIDFDVKKIKSQGYTDMFNLYLVVSQEFK